MKKTLEFWFISHGHIDPVWRWTIQEGISEILATFRAAVDILHDEPDLSFHASSAQFYEWVEHIDSNLFNEIKNFINQKRWIIVGGWWIEPDLNCPLGESLIRQGLYGQHYFKNTFGLYATVGFNPDAFGHPASLPQLLKGQGLTSYFFLRPGPHENNKIPGPLFKWESLDGSSINSFRIISEYNTTEYELEKRLEIHRKTVKDSQLSLNNIGMMIGWGNHGGGPTRKLIDAIKNTKFMKGESFQFSTANDYSASIKYIQSKLPIYSGELQHHARGCYSLHATVKEMNRQAEISLLTAEYIASFSFIFFQSPYPKTELKQAWKKVLFNQFHDILAGTSIESSYEDVKNDYGFSLSISSHIITQKMSILCLSIDTSWINKESAQPIVIFNPLSHKRNELIELECERVILNHNPIVTDELGNDIPYQIIKTDAIEIPERIKILFIANLPSFSIKSYSIDFLNNKLKKTLKTPSTFNGILENNLVVIRFNLETGYMTSYINKHTNHEYLLSDSAIPKVFDDPGDTWGHKIDSYNKYDGQFRNATFTILEWGNLRKRIQIKLNYSESTISQTFSLIHNKLFLHCHTKVNWHESYKVLKLCFNPSTNSKSHFAGIPAGAIRRLNSGNEEPFQSWVSLTDEPHGFSWMTKGKSSYSCTNNEFRLTILRSPAYNQHDPQKYIEGQGYNLIDQGIHEFEYQIIPHNNSWENMGIPLLAKEFLFPSIKHLTTVHTGKVKPPYSLISCEQNNIHVDAIKQAESSDLLIIRLSETHGLNTLGVIKFPYLNKEFLLNFKKFEIKTIRFNTILKTITETNLIENI
ncbi:MAG: alpha-mannosidase [Candidatus Marinimicrobia bacterium]|jgi:alpha-mannosidase|nr:alpha-mannosidase [Candidatus Neomarinimicrobiota bacterium]MBT3500732.1 alpha-mannosidase [Candidatus Neomarinimicrobiota bacterium]MBT3838679.1 alpha-mannosidase [Candidatus Neomarinimicrobiota bacterium]MBT4579797.1 alpha-mannosidase [Candidatus Neomarinimicrobiota bacterium]MBT4957265.1 alpha-mannosidase [Candidatus Neomarinimicrobiota bacterium]